MPFRPFRLARAGLAPQHHPSPPGYAPCGRGKVPLTTKRPPLLFGLGAASCVAAITRGDLAYPLTQPRRAGRPQPPMPPPMRTTDGLSARPARASADSTLSLAPRARRPRWVVPRTADWGRALPRCLVILTIPPVSILAKCQIILVVSRQAHPWPSSWARRFVRLPKATLFVTCRTQRWTNWVALLKTQ